VQGNYSFGISVQIPKTLQHKAFLVSIHADSMARPKMAYNMGIAAYVACLWCWFSGVYSKKLSKMCFCGYSAAVLAQYGLGVFLKESPIAWTMKDNPAESFETIEIRANEAVERRQVIVGSSSDRILSHEVYVARAKIVDIARKLYEEVCIRCHVNRNMLRLTTLRPAR